MTRGIDDITERVEGTIEHVGFGLTNYGQECVMTEGRQPTIWRLIAKMLKHIAGGLKGASEIVVQECLLGCSECLSSRFVLRRKRGLMREGNLYKKTAVITECWEQALNPVGAWNT